MRTAGRILAVAALLFPVTGLTPALGSTGIPSVLVAGTCLVANSTGQGPKAERVSTSGVFALRVTGESVQLDENDTFPDGYSVGTTNWWQFKYPNNGHLPNDRSRFCMRANGNLVLVTSWGKVIWASHTRGTGHHNSLHVENDGNLVMYNGAGTKVWASGTTRTILLAGHRLGSGRRMVDRYRQQFGIAPTRLIMRRSGDLVLYRSGHVLWSTHTHVRGAFAMVKMNGNLVVATPSGRVLWRSRTRGRDAVLELDCAYLSLTFRGWNPRTWHAPRGPQPVC